MRQIIVSIADSKTLLLAFNSKTLRRLCEDAAYADGELGKPIADVLRRRVADLSAATSIGDLLVGHPRQTAGGRVEIELVAGYKMVITANHVTNPKTEHGIIDWEKVSRVKILGIEQVTDND